MLWLELSRKRPRRRPKRSFVDKEDMRADGVSEEDAENGNK